MRSQNYYVVHTLAAVLFSLAAAELASDPAAVLRLTMAIPPVSLDVAMSEDHVDVARVRVFLFWQYLKV